MVQDVVVSFRPITEQYLLQARRWPSSGRHILAQLLGDSIFVYQAYRPGIGRYAAEHGRFGGAFSFSRMSWIKPNFLWMMYRSGWGTKPGQEVTLAIELSRDFFEEILENAVPSSFDPDLFSTREEWQAAVRESSVRLQWDPDHDPVGQSLPRRAVQLGLRGEVLRRFAVDECLSITDISRFVEIQRQNAQPPYEDLVTPREEVFTPRGERARRSLKLDRLSF